MRGGIYASCTPCQLPRLHLLFNVSSGCWTLLAFCYRKRWIAAITMPWHVSQNRKPEIMNYAEKDNSVLSRSDPRKGCLLYSSFCSFLFFYSNDSIQYCSGISESHKAFGPIKKYHEFPKKRCWYIAHEDLSTGHIVRSRCRGHLSCRVAVLPIDVDKTPDSDQRYHPVEPFGGI